MTWASVLHRREPNPSMIKLRTPIGVAAMLAATLISACAARETENTAVAAVQDGRIIAETQCGGCHASGREGMSPRADAPPLRFLFSHYRADTLAEEFMSGVKVGHPDMPLFEINPQGVDKLVAYLKSIQQPLRQDDAPR